MSCVFIKFFEENQFYEIKKQPLKGDLKNNCYWNSKTQ